MNQFGIIRLKDALLQMEHRDKQGNPVPFAVSFVTCDRRLGTGGKLIAYENAVLSRNCKRIAPILTGRTAAKHSRLPHHWKNKTRNITTPGSDKIRKIHICLITRFNGKKVVL